MQDGRREEKGEVRQGTAEWGREQPRETAVQGKTRPKEEGGFNC